MSIRNIPDPGIAGDDGSADADLTAALSAYAAAADADHRDVLVHLQHARLLVPVVAMLGDVEYDERGLAHEKTSDMATVLTRGRDGRLALLAFTSTDSLTAWNSDARPVPAPAARVAAAGLQDKAEAIVIDIAGPTVFVVEGGDLRALADGQSLHRVEGSYAWYKHITRAVPSDIGP